MTNLPCDVDPDEPPPPDTTDYVELLRRSIELAKRRHLTAVSNPPKES